MDGLTQAAPGATRPDGGPAPHSAPAPSARRRWLPKLRDWVTRYGLAEFGGITGALLGSSWVHAWTGNAVAAAYAATLGESVGFYGVVLVREAEQAIRARRGHRTAARPRELWGRARRLLLEFGPAELADVTVIRPAAIGIGTMVLGRQLGVPAGKLLADAVFYGTVVSAYELQRRGTDAAAGLASPSAEPDVARPSATRA